MGFFNKKEDNNTEGSTTFNMSSSELEQVINETPVDNNVEQQTIVNNAGSVNSSAVGNRVVQNTSPVQMMLTGAQTESSYSIPQANLTMTDTNTGVNSILGQINDDYSQTYDDPVMQGLSNIFNPYVDSDGNAYSNNKVAMFSSQFFGSDNNYYDSDATKAQAYKNMSYDFESYLSFYNYVSSDAEDAGLDFADVSNIYEEMIQKNWMISDYSPYSEVKDYRQYSKAMKSMGYTDEDVANSWNKVKTMKVSNDLQNYIGSSLGGMTTSGQILGRGSLLSSVKNTQPDIYANMTYNGTADNPYAIATTGALGAYFKNMNLTSYNNVEEVMVSGDVNNFTKTIITNNYAEYLKTGQDPEMFLEQLPTQVVQNFTSNLVYDPKTNTATLYNYSPELTRFENLHDPEFWRTYIDNAGGWSNGLFTFDDGRAESLAEEFMTQPLSAYLYSDGFDEGINQDNVDNLTKAINSTFGTEIESGDKNAVESLLTTYRAIPTDERNTARSALAGSDFGLLMDDIYSDTRIERQTSPQEFRHLVNTDGEKGFDWRNPIHELGYGASYALNELSNLSTGLYETTKYAVKDGVTSPMGIARHNVASISDNIDSKGTNAVANIDDFINHPLRSMRKNDITGESQNSMQTAIANGEMSIDDYTKIVTSNLNKYSDIIVAMDNAKIDANMAGDEARETFSSENGFIGGKIGSVFKLGDGAESVRTEAYDSAFRKSLVDQLGKDTVKQMEEYASLDKWANTSTVGFIDEQKDDLLRLAKSTLSEEEYQEWESDLFTDDKTKELRRQYTERTQTQLDTMKDLITPFIDNDRGNIDEGLNGYTKAYNADVDNTGEMNDLFFEIAFDPTTYITFGGEAVAKTGVRGLKSGLVGVGKGGRRTLTSGGNVVKNIAEETSESLYRSTAKSAKKTLGKKMSSSVYQDTVERQASYLKTMSKELNEMGSNLGKDILNDGYEDFEQETVKILSENLLGTSADFAKYKMQSDELLGAIKEASKRYRKFGYSRTEKEEAFELIKKSYDELISLNDDLISRVNSHQNGLAEIIERSNPDGKLRKRLEQYANAYDGLLENNNVMGKYFRNNIANGETLGDFLEQTLYDMFRTNTSYQGIHGSKVLSNLLDNMDGVSDDIMRYIHEDNLTPNDLSRMLTERLELKGKLDLPGAKTQVNNSIHDLVDLVDNRLVDRGRTFDRMSDIMLNDDIGEELTELGLKNVGNRTAVKAKQIMIDDKVFGEISKQNGFDDDLRKIGNDFVRSQFIDGNPYDVDSALESALKRQTSKYKRAVNALNKELDPVQTTIANFHDKDALYPLVRQRMHDLLIDYIPNYDEFINANSGEFITEIKRELGIRDNLPNSELIDAINDANGFTNGDLSLNAIFNGLGTDNIKNELNDVLSGMLNGDIDIDDGLLNMMTQRVTAKDITQLVSDRFAFLGEDIVGKEGGVPITKSAFSRMSKENMINAMGKDGMFNILKDAPTMSYENMIKYLDGSDIKRLMPNLYKKADDALRIRQQSGLVKKVTNFDEIVDSNTLMGKLSHASFIESVAPHAFQENIDILERIKELNSVVSRIGVDVANDEFALGKQGLNELKQAKRLGLLYKTGGKDVGDLARNNMPNMTFDGLVTSLNKNYGTHKMSAMKDIIDELTEGMSNSIWDTYTQPYTTEMYNDAVKGLMKARGKTSQHVDTMTTLAQHGRKLAGVTGEKSVVHDGIKRAWGAVDNTLRARQTQNLTLRKSMGTKVTNTIDELLHYKNHVISDSEMTSSEHQFFKNVFLDSGSSNSTKFTFSLDKNRMGKVVQEMKNVEVPFGTKDETFKLGEVFNISARATEDQGFGDSAHILDVSFNHDNKYMDDEQFKQTADFLSNSFSFDDKEVIDELGEKVTQSDVFLNIKNSFTPHMNDKFPDLFQRSGRINLIDSDTIKNIHKTIDDKIDAIKEYADPEVIDQYIVNYHSVMAKVEQQAYDVMYAMDSSGELFKDSEYWSFFETMSKRRNHPDDMTNLLIPEMKNRNMRTFYNSKVNKKLGADNKGPENWSILRSKPNSMSRGIVRDARIKGSPQGKTHVLNEVYGTGSKPIVTNLNSYINNVSQQNVESITRTAFANKLHEFSSGVIKNIDGKGAKSIGTFDSEIQVNLNELKNGLFADQPNLYKKFVKNLRKTHNIPIGDNDIVKFARRDFNQLEAMGLQIRDVTDMSTMWKVAHKIQTTSQRMMLLGTFNTKAIMSTIPNLMMTPGGNGIESLSSVYDTVSENLNYKWHMKQNPSGFMNALNEVASLDNISYEQMSQIGSKHLKGGALKAWNKKNKYSVLRNSSSTSWKNYGRYKKMTHNTKDLIEMNQGSEATLKDMMGYSARTVVDGILPNSSVFDNAILSRASYLVDNPDLLNKLLKSNYSEELVEGFDMQDLASSAMRLAESEFGMTDGILNSKRSKLDLLIPFRHQLISGIPNIFATYFGTPEGILSTMQMQRRFNQIGASSAGMSQIEYNENLDDDDYGKLVLGGNMGESTKLLTLNTYSPFDIVNQFVGSGNTPMGVFFDSISPTAKLPVELASGQELGNYKTNGSHVEKFHNAMTVGDSKTAVKEAILAGTEATGGNLYRWTNQYRKLATGKDNAGKQLMYFPTSTDAEINLVRSMLGQYGVSVKDGRLDELPFMSTIFNSKNASEDVHTENLINSLQEITYNDTYMDALADEELNPNGYTVRSGIYNTINKYSERAVAMSGDDLTAEYKAVIDAMQNGDNEALKEAYRNSKMAKLESANKFMGTLSELMGTK